MSKQEGRQKRKLLAEGYRISGILIKKKTMCRNKEKESSLKTQKKIADARAGS